MCEGRSSGAARVGPPGPPHQLLPGALPELHEGVGRHPGCKAKVGFLVYPAAWELGVVASNPRENVPAAEEWPKALGGTDGLNCAPSPAFTHWSPDPQLLRL